MKMYTKNRMKLKETPMISKNCYLCILLVLSVGLFIVTLLAVALIEAKAARNVSDDYLVEMAYTPKRPARETVNSTMRKSKTEYYEEQRPVVVNAESSEPLQTQNQNNFGSFDAYGEPYDQNPYYEESDADDYANSPYEQSDYQQQQQRYMGEENYNGQHPSDVLSNAEGRGAQGQQYDSYYGQWRVAATPDRAIENVNRKNPSMNRMTQNSSPYNSGGGSNLRPYNYPLQEREPYHTQPPYISSTSKPTNLQEESDNTGSTILTIIRSLKQMWDIYQALSSTWNSIYEHQQRQAELLQKQQKEKFKELKKSRINSKKPTDMETVKNLRQKSNTTTTVAPEKTDQITDTVSGKVEPRKNRNNKPQRKQRNAADSNDSTDVGEGRYIKGDPLKGYYDFVITEGSYKFWAVFQVGTAILIIYSTFAAIYYSKVNPLVSDYDYTDYLGGGRSLTGGDLDFVDDGDTGTGNAQSKSASFTDWLPNTKHSLKFILDAIDKIPADHDV